MPVCAPDFNGTPDMPMFQPESSEHAHNNAVMLITRPHMTILCATFIDLRWASINILDGSEHRICYNFFFAKRCSQMESTRELVHAIESYLAFKNASWSLARRSDLIRRTTARWWSAFPRQFACREFIVHPHKRAPHVGASALEPGRMVLRTAPGCAQAKPSCEPEAFNSVARPPRFVSLWAAHADTRGLISRA